MYRMNLTQHMEHSLDFEVASTTCRNPMIHLQHPTVKSFQKEEELSTNGMAREFASRLALCSAFGTQFHVAWGACKTQRGLALESEGKCVHGQIAEPPGL